MKPAEIKNQKKSAPKGSTLLYLLVIIGILPLVLYPVIGNIVTQAKLLREKVAREQALQVAEAGINYYQWRLAHYPNDFQDGTGHSGPYVHNYVDYDTQQLVGQYSLVITPPPTGSTVVTIQSTGSVSANPGVARTITARYGNPSLALYAFLSNDVIWMGDTETVGGQLQSNNGVRFDGVGNAPILSAKSSYLCPSTQGDNCPATKPGVWGYALQATKNFWNYPVPAVDFSALTSTLAGLKTLAQSGGIYLPPSNDQGYSLLFNADGTITVRKVSKLDNSPKGVDVYGTTHNEKIDYKENIHANPHANPNGIGTTVLFTQTIPANGIIYVEDKVWVEGTINGRATVAAAILPYNPSTAPTIYIPDNIAYAAKDGTDVLGLISQKNIVVTYNAPDNLEIDAALIAQNGSAEMFDYYNGQAVKNSISIFGSIMSFGQWTWSYISGNTITSGYPNTSTVYDSSLLYAPPPGFPLSSAGYQLLTWTSN